MPYASLDTTNYKIAVRNISTHALQLNDWPTFDNTIYNTNGTLTANRTLSGAGFNLSLGTSGSKVGFLDLFATNVRFNGDSINQFVGPLPLHKTLPVTITFR